MKIAALTTIILSCMVSTSCSNKPTETFAVGNEVEYGYQATGKPEVCVPVGTTNTLLFKGAIVSAEGDGYTVKWQTLTVKDFPAGTECTKNPMVWDNSDGTTYSTTWQAYYLGSPGVPPGYFPDLPAKFNSEQLKISQRE